MSKRKAVDKTVIFQSLERELRAGGKRGIGVRAQLDDAARDLEQYFEKHSMLVKALNVGGLTYEHAFLTGKTKEVYVAKIVKVLLAEFRNARDLDAQSFLPFWAGRMQKTDRAIKNTAAVAVLQGNKEDLEPSFLVKSWFREMGDLLEGSFQPLARLRLEVLSLLGRRGTSAPAIEIMSFGAIISELLAEPELGEFYRPPPFGLSVSQWRNIANHNSFDVTGGQITCTYGTPDKLKTLCLSIDELASVLTYCNDLYYAHKVAIEFFGIDNLMELIQYEPDISPSEYSHTTSLAYGLVSAGFSIIRASHLPNKWSLILTDLHARRLKEVKTALQEACYPYMLFVHPVEISAVVRSNCKTYKLGFIASVAKKNEPLPECFRGDIWSVEDSFRLGQKIPKR